jgi:bifunctional DNA-binding transcriptional regulator/antitoxin component of YhaV-PrlF toxin-antitoxin module
MADETVCDERGRCLLPKEVRQRFGTRFRVFMTHDEVVLRPIVKDPVKLLAELGKKSGISRLSMAQIKREIEKEALKEVYGELRLR